jgi:hypothetical protein
MQSKHTDAQEDRYWHLEKRQIGQACVSMFKPLLYHHHNHHHHRHHKL